MLRGIFPIAFSALTLVAMFCILVTIDVELALVSLAIIPSQDYGNAPVLRNHFVGLVLLAITAVGLWIARARWS